MSLETVRDKIVAEFGDEVVTDSVLFRDELTVVVTKERILDVARFVKDDPELSFDFLSFVAGVDNLPADPRFEVVYQLYSTGHSHRMRVKTPLQTEGNELPAIDSVYEVWPTADWHERETAEMFGITFNNHPDPRKLLLPDEWDVYPLRKDFPVEGTDAQTPDLPAGPGRQEGE
jgi:NADH-quinone oxidoreductase subunit C